MSGNWTCDRKSDILTSRSLSHHWVINYYVCRFCEIENDTQEATSSCHWISAFWIFIFGNSAHTAWKCHVWYTTRKTVAGLSIWYSGDLQSLVHIFLMFFFTVNRIKVCEICFLIKFTFLLLSISRMFKCSYGSDGQISNPILLKISNLLFSIPESNGPNLRPNSQSKSQSNPSFSTST